MSRRLAALLLPALLCAQGAPDRLVQPGQPAPPLQVSEWIKGEPVPTFEKGKVYLVEFWATWCGPCIGSIPHLTELQKRHAKDGLVVIGLTSPDPQLGKDAFHEMNTLPTVRAFVAKRGAQMGYRVAFDQAQRETFRSYFGADSAGIPHGFVIDREGKVVYGTHPFYLDLVLEEVLAGTWNAEKGRARMIRLRQLMNGPDEESKAAFQARRAQLAKEFPAYAERTLSQEMLRAVLGGDLATATRIGERMMKDPLGGDMAYTLNQLLNKAPYAPKAKALLPLAGRMSEAYLRTIPSDPTAHSLRADWFKATGRLPEAVACMKKAIEAEIEPRRGVLQPRLQELEQALAARKS